MTAKQLPVTFDIKMMAGDDFVFDVLIEDEDGNAIDFSNWSNERLQVRKRPTANRVLQEYTTVDGDLTTTAAGRVQATFDASDTKDWTPNVAYEMEGDDADGNRRTVIEGEIQVNVQTSR